MTLTEVPKRPVVAARRAGYVVAVLVNAAILYAVNVWPGWQALPFLTDDVSLVLELVNASILVNVAANMVYVVADPHWLKALGDVLTTGVGLAALLQIWRVFPFDFSGNSFDWALVVRIDRTRVRHGRPGPRGGDYVDLAPRSLASRRGSRC